MEYLDLSLATSDDVGARRTIDRRGIVIHESDGVASLPYLQGESAKGGRPVSTDFLILRSGDIVQVTKVGRYAYHTGTARWRFYQEQDRTINQGFYGITCECYVRGGEKITSAQYVSLAWLLRLLMRRSNVSFMDICGHYQVALPHGRRDDPQTLNWAILSKELVEPSSWDLPLDTGDELP